MTIAALLPIEVLTWRTWTLLHRRTVAAFVALRRTSEPAVSPPLYD